MIIDKEEIANVFSIFHDGDIMLFLEEGNNQTWKINCQYLAELIDPTFEYFLIEINNCSLLDFHPWINVEDSPKVDLKKSSEIFSVDLEILSANLNNQKIEITCNREDKNIDSSGGILILDCKSITVSNQRKEEINLSKLKEISSNYWNNFGSK